MMTNWDDYSIYDLVTLSEKDQFRQYISMIRTLFTQLENIYEQKVEKDFEAREEHAIVLSYLHKLFYTFELLYTKYLYSQDTLRVDFSDSGFVNFFEISQLETDLRVKINGYAVKGEQQHLKKQMIEHIFSQRTHPVELLEKMARSVYKRELQEENIFSFFNPGELHQKESTNPEFRKYFYHWACYDKKSNMPYIYLMEFEQDIEEKALHLDEKALDTFMAIIRSEGSRAPAAGIVAMAIDQRLHSIHPKVLKRICLGPIYSKSFAAELSDEMLAFLAHDENGFVCHIDEQFVFSEGHAIVTGKKLLGDILQREGIRERFYIPKPSHVDEYAMFNELEAQKASLIRKSVVMPYKLHQHSGTLYNNYKIVSFTPEGHINGIQ